eukprot:CAMPEP_0184290576 /NCGR_PEP_ID=MMETSP1049-20130417/2758_1 /TAXON_ID=77928 /ORGANISM="Proteomonas sulcata, Strain CCMP704" /LENGTH=81 /DNA_ID=CAMNT_0026597747 /DNA_START=1885 /DNA_END=2127 /DNA_ORIENTATION=+
MRLRTCFWHSLSEVTATAPRRASATSGFRLGGGRSSISGSASGAEVSAISIAVTGTFGFPSKVLGDSDPAGGTQGSLGPWP